MRIRKLEKEERREERNLFLTMNRRLIMRMIHTCACTNIIVSHCKVISLARVPHDF